MVRQAQAESLALGGKPDAALCTALGRTPEEAAMIEYDAYRKQREAAIKARYGFNP